MTQKIPDSTIDEIHKMRREISDRFGGDVFAIAEDAARRQAASNRPVWKPKHDEQSDAVERRNGPNSESTSTPAAH
jgi:hypothetical protein